MKVPWFDGEVELHSARQAKCTGLTKAECAFKYSYWVNSTIIDHVYAESTVYLICGIIGICVLLYWAARLAPNKVRSSLAFQKISSYARFISYKRFRILGWETPSLGRLTLFTVVFVFFTAMSFGPKPLYWPNTETVSFGTSPPLAIRTSYLAIALLPFVFILPTKTNPLAFITGSSHERLIGYHAYLGWAMFVLALVHGLVFIKYDVDTGILYEKFSSEISYWTGVVCIFANAYLVVFSLPAVRNRFYEFFKATHIFVALAFMVFLFPHTNFRLTSWDYIIAAGALYLVAFAAAQIRTGFRHGVVRATLTMASPSTLKVALAVPRRTTWTPAQHVFVRFFARELGLHVLTSHPFTICSVPATTSAGGKGEASPSANEMVLYIAPRGGITGRLASLVQARSTGVVLAAHIDGPYGGLRHHQPLEAYDRAVVVACGSGAGTSLPFVMGYLLRMQRERVAFLGAGGDVQVWTPANKMTVMVATRDLQIVEWYREAMDEFVAANGMSDMISALEQEGKSLEVRIYLTSQSGESASSPSLPGQSSSDEETPAQLEKEVDVRTTTMGQTAVLSSTSSDRSLPAYFKVHRSGTRPDIAGLVHEATTSEANVSVGLAVCGPPGVVTAVQDEAAAAQLRIARGNDEKGAREVYLHAESFSW